MLISEAKIEFLKNVDEKSKVDIVKFAKSILPRMMQETSTYSVITELNINQTDAHIDRKTLLSFYKAIYDQWYDYYSKINEEKLSGKISEAIKKIKTDPRFKKENMSPLDCEKFIFETYDKEFKDSGIQPLQTQSGRKISDHYDDFIHVYPFLPPRDINCRLYLNLKPENAIKLGEILTEKCMKKRYRVYFKLWTGMNDRNDTFLIYTGYKKVQEFVNILKEIKSEHPDLFVGAEKSSGLLPMIDGFIGFGEEPQYRHSSFNFERGEALDEFFRDRIKEEAKRIGNYKGYIRNSKDEDLSLKEYIKYLITESFKEALNDRQREIKNHQFPDTYTTEKQIKAYIEIQDKIYKACRDELPEFVEQYIDEKVEFIIEDLKKGVMPESKSFSIPFKTRLFSLFNYGERYIKHIKENNQYLNYYFKIDLDLKEKLFDIFSSKVRIGSKITKENLKPYFEKHYVSIERPYLNTESEIELEESIKEDKSKKTNISTDEV